MNRTVKETVRQVRQVILPLLAEYNYQLVDCEYVREHQGWVLRIFLDRHGGITVEDCAEISDEIGDVLDVKGVFETSYRLEVSSPGLDRRVRDPADFDRFAGSQIRLRTEVPVQGRRQFSGTLLGMAGDAVAVEADGETFRIPLEAIEKANLKYQWKK
jgi:ribosome maturation factor RimP